ncbi:MAG: hypothetical protein JF603_13440 [Acidobacteria bacterium]|nr:hypothetical protein [Acidobacteriota bacterium]
MTLRRRPPAAHVLDAFGVDRGALLALEGGEGSSWRAGEVVLEPGLDPRFAAWLAVVGGRVDTAGRFRLATPVAALDGRLVVGGWSATTWMAGHQRPGDVADILELSATLHDAMRAADLPWPGFLRARTDRWAVADRVAWGEERPARFLPAPLRDVLDGLAPLLREPWTGAEPQVVHGDLAGNVLFDDDGLPPAVIDLSPLHRPAAFADAVVLADAIAWHGAAPSAAADFAATSSGHQLLARAVAFRLVAAPTEIEAYRPVIELLIDPLGARPATESAS